MTEKRIIEFEGRWIGIVQSKDHEKQRLKKVNGASGIYTKLSIFMRIPEGEEGEKDTKEKLELNDWVIPSLKKDILICRCNEHQV